MTFAASQDEKIEFLKTTDIFKYLNEETLGLLAKSCERVSLKPGEFLFLEGEDGDAMFMILSGELSIEKQNSVIAKRGKGDHLGEMALIESGPRSASAKAITQSNLLKISKEHFQDFFTSNPQLLMEVLKKISLRSREDLKTLDEGVKKIEDHQKRNTSLQTLLNDTSNEIYAFDPQSYKFIEMNSRALDNLGYEEDEITGLQLFDVLKNIRHEKFEERVEPLRLKQVSEIIFDGVHQRKDGSTYPVNIWLKLNENDNPPVFSAVIQDLSQIKEIENKYHQLSTYDPLTELPNRKMVLMKLASALSKAKEGSKSLAVLVIGLDNFDQVDHSLGNQAGEIFLKAVADRLKDWLPPNGFLGLNNGTEFILVLSDINFETEAASAARHILKTFQSTVSINGEQIYPKINIGISYYPLDGDDPENLVKQGATAKDYAKNDGANTYSHFSTDMGFQIKNKLILERDLQRALENEEFELYYQPKLHLPSETITGVESLLRWKHPERGFVSPGDFIPVAEKSHLIFDIGDWVLKTACRQLKTWSDMKLPIKNVAVNLSAQQFNHPEFFSRIAEIVMNEEIFPEYLELEITETSVMENLEAATAKLKQLHGIGIKISLDDFGTGYSSLGYLNKFPLSNLKIDQSFVSDIVTEQDAIIAKGIVSLAKTFNLKTVAEGVETEEQKEIMRSIGCDFIQGYLLSKPLPAREATELFSSLRQS